MAKFFALFVALLAFNAALAAPKKNQGQQAGAQKDQNEDVISQVQGVVNDVSNSLQKVLPDEKQVSDALTTGTQEFAQNVENIVKKLQDEINKHKGEGDNVLQQVSGSITENINALKKLVGPEATAKANEIRVELDNNVKNTAAEIESLVNVVKPNLEQAGQTVNDFAKGILNDFLQAAENLKTQVETSVQPQSRSMKQKH